jgi:phage I-like protein
MKDCLSSGVGVRTAPPAGGKTAVGVYRWPSRVALYDKTGYRIHMDDELVVESPADGMSVVLSVRISQAGAGFLDAEVERLKCSRSEAVRAALRDWSATTPFRRNASLEALRARGGQEV